MIAWYKSYCRAHLAGSRTGCLSSDGAVVELAEFVQGICMVLVSMQEEEQQGSRLVSSFCSSLWYCVRSKRYYSSYLARGCLVVMFRMDLTSSASAKQLAAACHGSTETSVDGVLHDTC